MAKYNKLGVDEHGKVDPLRGLVHDIIGMMPSGPGSRPMADDLYKSMKAAGKGGKDDEDDKEDGKGNGKDGGINDVDFDMSGQQRRLRVPSVKMKQGGLVRGGGCAQRGRGKGKMV